MAIGVITGSGTYALPGLEGAELETVQTPFGSTEVSRGRVEGGDVLHIPATVRATRASPIMSTTAPTSGHSTCSAPMP